MRLTTKRISLLPDRLLNRFYANSRTPNQSIFTAACFLCALLLFFAGPAAAVQGSAAPDEASSPGDVIPIPILAYHNIAEELPQGNHSYYVTVEQFEKQLDVIQAYGYETIHLRDLLDYRSGAVENLPEKPVIITFDDGYEGVFKYACPALKKRGMTATFFILTKFTAEENEERMDSSEWKDEDIPVSSHMTWEEIKALSKGSCEVSGEETNGKAFEIGSHTKSHANLLDSGDLQSELEGSKNGIVEHLESDAQLFLAYPYGEGAGDERIESAVRDAGYQGAVGFGHDAILQFPADPDSQDIDLFNLPRMQVTSDFTMVFNGQGSYGWFINRLDPGFYPVIWTTGLRIVGSDGQPRTRFNPGETVKILVRSANWGSPVKIAAKLSLFDADNRKYTFDKIDSEFPSESYQTFEFMWTVPDSVDSTGRFTYQFHIDDEFELLNFASESGQIPDSFVYLPTVSR